LEGKQIPSNPPMVLYGVFVSSVFRVHPESANIPAASTGKGKAPELPAVVANPLIGARWTLSIAAKIAVPE